jgi:hypothetical protein
MITYFSENNGNRVKLYIKYMVSIRCKMLVKADAGKNWALPHRTIELGEEDLLEEINPVATRTAEQVLKKVGLELMD